MNTLLICISAFVPFAPQEVDPDEKIDRRVSRMLERRDRVLVTLLGATQLLEMPDGFAKFCKANAGRKRSKLRKEVIKKLKEIAEKEQKEILEALDSPSGARGLWIVNAISVTLDSDQIEAASKLKSVKYIYPPSPASLRVRRAGAAGTVKEVLTPPSKREAFTADGKKVAWNLKKIKADKVWKDLKVTGEGAVVAMFDVGVRYTQQDLRDNIWINEDEVPNNGEDDDGNGYVDDYYGFNFRAMRAEVAPGGRMEHGTLTSGIVAGDGTGGTVTGVAPRARLMIVSGGGEYRTALVHQYALEKGADVMNMSFSIPGLGNLRGFYRLMSEQATCAGLVLVSGAGNFQQNQRIPVQMRIPEGIPAVICAGGVNQNMKVPTFCSLGPVEWENVKFYEDHPMPDGLVKPDVCGFPGPRYPLLASRDKGYIDPNPGMKGNSFSGPHVTGVVALMFSANPELTAWRVKEILEETATDIGEKGKDTRTGAGLVNALKAVEAAKKEAEY